MTDTLTNILEQLHNQNEELETLKLTDVIVDERRKTVHFSFLCEKTVSETVQERILSAFNEVVPDGFLGVTLSVEKKVADEELIAHTVYTYLKSTQNAVSAELRAEDVTADASGAVKRYRIAVTPATYALFEKNRVLSACDNHLYRNFCGSFQGSLSVEKEEVDEGPLPENNTVNFRVETVKLRSFYVKDLTPIDDKNMSRTAVYMEDIAFPTEGVVHAGRVLSVTEKVTKKGKPFFIFEFTDTTKTIKVSYFTRKNTLERVRAIKEGDSIITMGSYDEFGGSLRYTADKLNLCTFPEDFKPLPKEKRKPAPEYVLVKPEQVTSVRQKALFDVEEDLPACLMNKTFVVFDLETTGTVPSADAITEIGAVRIVNGKQVDGFSTFVNPGRPIPKQIVELTGITDEMVADAPTFAEVVGDFYKYVDGAILVAHNADFDCGFIRFHGKEAGYVFDNPRIDTLPLAREQLPRLANHKLNTVCAHFGIEFQHHRAVYDSVATAEMFLELIKMKKCLPN